LIYRGIACDHCRLVVCLPRACTANCPRDERGRFECNGQNASVQSLNLPRPGPNLPCSATPSLTASNLHFVGAPRGFVCLDRNSPCCRPSPSGPKQLEVPCSRSLLQLVPEVEFLSDSLLTSGLVQPLAQSVSAKSGHFVSTEAEYSPEIS